MSWALMAEGAVIFLLSGRFIPQAAQRSCESTESEISASANSREECLWLRASPNVISVVIDGAGRVMS